MAIKEVWIVKKIVTPKYVMIHAVNDSITVRDGSINYKDIKQQNEDRDQVNTQAVFCEQY